MARRAQKRLLETADQRLELIAQSRMRTLSKHVADWIPNDAFSLPLNIDAVSAWLPNTQCLSGIKCMRQLSVGMGFYLQLSGKQWSIFSLPLQLASCKVFPRYLAGPPFKRLLILWRGARSWAFSPALPLKIFGTATRPNDFVSCIQYP